MLPVFVELAYTSPLVFLIHFLKAIHHLPGNKTCKNIKCKIYSFVHYYLELNTLQKRGDSIRKYFLVTGKSTLLTPAAGNPFINFWLINCNPS